jgi:hypothetical protein
VRFVDEAELEALIAPAPHDAPGAARAGAVPHRGRDGLRQGELMGLCWRDMDWAARRIRQRSLLGANRHKLVAATSPTATTGRVVSPWKGMPCNDLVHHCPLSVAASRAAVTGAGRYLNLVASAQADGVVGNQVLAVEPEQGELQVVQILGPYTASRPLLSLRRLRSFSVSTGGSEASKESQRAAIIFSRPLMVKAGDVLDVRTRFNLTIHNSKDNAPFTGTSIFLTRRPTTTFPDRALSIVGRAGQNCPTSCSLTRLGAIRSPVGGRRYVNVVVVVKDHEGETKATASDTGTLSVVVRH